MTTMRIVNADSTRPTFNIIEREPVFVNPFITLDLFYLPIHHFPSQNRRLHPIVSHLLLWNTQNIFA